MKYIISLLIAISLVGCSSRSDTERALSGAGYTDIQTEGFRIFGCSEDDTFRTGFTAVGPTGKKVSGVVCSNFMKGSTIRFD